jgi:hypothetical protein
MKVILDYPDLSLFLKEVTGLTFSMHAAIEQLEKKCGSKNFEISESASLLLKMLSSLEDKINHQNL